MKKSNSNTFQLAGQMEEAFNSVGESMMSDDFAGKLLAYLLDMGGNSEIVVVHTGLNAGIAIAQQKFNMKGGEVPKIEGIIIFNKYLKEIKQYGLATEWLWEIYLRYNLNTSHLESKCHDYLKEKYNVVNKIKKKK